MKRLTITYGELTLVDTDVTAITWTETAESVGVTASLPSQPAKAAGWLDLLAGAARKRAESSEETHD